ncbi:elongation factor G [Lacticaseibacillus sharpeae]|uniref:Elongation factor g n=1 Tax=Lacticaseibacillus sharpeae JCM 1186 = DSM 20505 TaxID=1291052 RepID=A0A0R1ZHW3_9LACO|nr:TetM/TetW/TetO/TetS family tetracycline resistance ribosomal protection protein [Lacticaseibacillus sharpeae]KRM54445.1 elongation factor g [Lacticaseibacillus sharpeae JCM 1186 = DSM 20505]
MKHITAGIIAHVDAGKTTLSEAMLYQTGAVRKLGRVDNADAFLDTDSLEKKRGITIFAHQAQVQFDDLELTLLDTPGHVDFASQTEQVLSVLDYAILVVSATDGVQGYTRTLWRLLARYHVPAFIFVNKMDASGVDQAAVLTQLQSEFPGAVDFTAAADGQLPDAALEEIALQDEALLDAYMESGTVAPAQIQALIKQRQVFPVYFGAALKLTGVDAIMTGLAQWTQELMPVSADFGARVFKITHDDNGERLTWLRVTSGELQTKAVLNDEKVNQLRVYNGAKFTVIPVATAGTVCAVTGLTKTYPGQGLGALAAGLTPAITPVLTYAVQPQDGDIHACLTALRVLEDEDPLLKVTWSEHLQEIRVQIMGTVQLEVLQQLLQDRFNLNVQFDAGSILYKETITDTVEGVGHFEPLRHYAEVHLLLEPGPVGSGVQFATDLPLDILGRNWQHQVIANLGAKEHLGVLIGAPVTDMKVTLIGGRASIKHSVGGDFREATWRAVRQGLMELKQRGACALLEPWYHFRLEVAQDQVGRAMTDIQRMSGTFAVSDASGDGSRAVLTGDAPVAEMQSYAQDVRAYTHGQGQLECIVAGYRPCHNADAVVANAAYDPVRDLENTPDSVFCAHGAGYPVAWNDVPAMAHVAYRI